MSYQDTLVDNLGRHINNALRENNKPIIEAINNLAKNTGNKTTREYNELKDKYEELEKSFKKSDFLLKSIITMYTLVLINHNPLGGSLSSDNIVKIMDQTYDEIQKRKHGDIPNVLYESMIDTGNEVYEKLMRR